MKKLITYIFLVLFWLIPCHTKANVIDSLNLKLSQETSSTVQSEIEFQLGLEYSQKGMYEESLKYLRKSYSFYKGSSSRDNLKVATYEAELSKVYYYLTFYDVSLEYAFKALLFFEKNPNGDQPNRVLNIIGNIHRINGQYDDAMIYLNKALKLAKSDNNKKLESYTLNNISTIYFSKENYKESLKIDFLNLAVSKKIRDTILIAGVYNNIASNYVKLNMTDSALVYLFYSLNLKTGIDEFQRRAVTYSNIAEVKEIQEELTEAIYFYKKGVQFSEVSGDVKMLLKCIKGIASVYTKKKNYKLANEYLIRYIDKKEKQKEEEISKTTSKLHAVYNLTIKEKELEIANSELNFLKGKQKIERKKKIWMLSTIGVILIVFFLLVIRYFQKLKMTNQSILIYEQQLSLNEYKLHSALANKKKLLEEVELIRSQLSETSIDLLKKEELISKFSKLVLDIEKELGGGTSLQKIKKLLKQKKTNNTWVEFEKLLNNMYPSFMKDLKEQHEKLTINDLRHCAYIKMQLTTKEIASILNISPTSVQTSRVRLKKKMNLQKDEQLYDYVNSFPK